MTGKVGAPFQLRRQIVQAGVLDVRQTCRGSGFADDERRRVRPDRGELFRMSQSQPHGAIAAHGKPADCPFLIVDMEVAMHLVPEVLDDHRLVELAVESFVRGGRPVEIGRGCAVRQDHDELKIGHVVNQLRFMDPTVVIVEEAVELEQHRKGTRAGVRQDGFIRRAPSERVTVELNRRDSQVPPLPWLALCCSVPNGTGAECPVSSVKGASGPEAWVLRRMGKGSSLAPLTHRSACCVPRAACYVNRRAPRYRVE